MRLILFLCVLILLESCSSKVTTTSSQTGGKYSEDLSGLRTKKLTPADSSKSSNTSNNNSQRDPSQYIEARHTVNASVDAVLDSIDRINLSHGTVDGYTIQLYSGVKREDALSVRKQLSIALPTLEADVQFVQPNFRVRTGKYIDRLEAQKDYMAVKKYFPNAIVIPERIPIH